MLRSIGDRIERFYRIGIRIKTLMVLLAATALGLLSTGAVYYNFSQVASREAALEHLKTAAENQAKRVEQLREQYIKRVNLLAGQTQLRRSLRRLSTEGPAATRARRIMAEILDDALATDTEFKAMYVVARNGRVLASTQGVSLDNPPPCRQQCGRSSQPEIHIHRDGKQPVLRISQPLKVEGRIFGTLIVDSSIEAIKKITADYTGLGETGETIIAAPDPKGKFHSLTPLRHGSGKIFSPLTIQPHKGLDKLTIYDFVDYRGKDVLAAKVDVPGTDWIVFVKRDQKEIFQRPRTLRNLMACLMLATLIMAVCLGVLFSSTLTKPILRIVYATHRMAKGDLNVRIAANRTDEIGDLARSVNEMADRMVETKLGLEKKINERTEALNTANQQLKQAREELSEIASHDQLTGLLNRHGFDEALAAEWKRGQRNGTNVGLILVAVDHFERFDDCGGPHAADECLRRISRILSEQVREAGAVLTRYSGTQIATIIPGWDIDVILRFAEKLCKAVYREKIRHPAPERDYVTISAGAASLVPELDQSADMLLRCAHDALYAAKGNGSNRVRAFREAGLSRYQWVKT